MMIVVSDFGLSGVVPVVGFSAGLTHSGLELDESGQTTSMTMGYSD